jgi:hypothetical protein
VEGVSRFPHFSSMNPLMSCHGYCFIIHVHFGSCSGRLWHSVASGLELLVCWAYMSIEMFVGYVRIILFLSLMLSRGGLFVVLNIMLCPFLEILSKGESTLHPCT